MRPLKLSVITISVFLFVVLFAYYIYKYVKLRTFATHAYTPPCYKGEAGGEWGERDVAYKFTDPSASVLEFGGGSGSVSLVIQSILNNRENHVVIQPIDNSAMFGGYNQLCRNRTTCKASFSVIDHVLKAGEAPQILSLVSKPFDLVVADCEGCLVQEYKKNPSLFEHVTMIQVERDDQKREYDGLLKTLNMQKIFSGPHSGWLTVEVWVRCVALD